MLLFTWKSSAGTQVTWNESIRSNQHFDSKNCQTIDQSNNKNGLKCLKLDKEKKHDVLYEQNTEQNKMEGCCQPLTELLSKTVWVVTWSRCDFCRLWCIKGRLWGGTAQGNVMSSCRVEGEPSVAGSCPLYWVEVWGPGAMAQRVSALPPTCKHSVHTRAYQSWPLHRGCLPTSLPACLPAGGERPGLKRTGTINECLDVFHVLLCYLSACVHWVLVFVWGMYVVWSGENFMLLSDGALWKVALVYKVWSKMCMQLPLIFP